MILSLTNKEITIGALIITALILLVLYFLPRRRDIYEVDSEDEAAERTVQIANFRMVVINDILNCLNNYFGSNLSQNDVEAYLDDKGYLLIRAPLTDVLLFTAQINWDASKYVVKMHYYIGDRIKKYVYHGKFLSGETIGHSRFSKFCYRTNASILQIESKNYEQLMDDLMALAKKTAEQEVSLEMLYFAATQMCGILQENKRLRKNAEFLSVYNILLAYILKDHKDDYIAWLKNEQAKE